MKARQDRAVRWHEDTGFEARCLYCEEWWPLDLVHWQPRNGLARCKACWRLYKTLHQAGRMASELAREAKRQADRARYHGNRARNLEAQRHWRAANKPHIAAYNRAYREAHREDDRRRAREYYAEARDVILIKKRQAHAAKKLAA